MLPLHCLWPQGLARAAHLLFRQGVNFTEKQLNKATGRQPVWMDGCWLVTCPVCGLLPHAIIYFSLSLSHPIVVPAVCSKASEWTLGFSSTNLHTHQLRYNFQSCTNHTKTTGEEPPHASFLESKVITSLQRIQNKWLVIRLGEKRLLAPKLCLCLHLLAEFCSYNREFASVQHISEWTLNFVQEPVEQTLKVFLIYIYIKNMSVQTALWWHTCSPAFLKLSVCNIWCHMISYQLGQAGPELEAKVCGLSR